MHAYMRERLSDGLKDFFVVRIVIERPCEMTTHSPITPTGKASPNTPRKHNAPCSALPVFYMRGRGSGAFERGKLYERRSENNSNRTYTNPP